LAHHLVPITEFGTLVVEALDFMYQHIVFSDSLEWKPLDFPGVSMRVLHQDKRTGGMTVLTRLEPGASIPAHMHSLADETVYVVSGDFIEIGVAHKPGTFFTAAAGVSHGPHQSLTGCVVLTTFSAALDFHLV
jgi:quercetin dioxygenase-like cupin family protein